MVLFKLVECKKINLLDFGRFGFRPWPTRRLRVGIPVRVITSRLVGLVEFGLVLGWAFVGPVEV